MFYDTHHRHNDALNPEALTTIPTALHALNAAIEDCGHAGKSPERDAAVLLLIHNLKEVARKSGLNQAELRVRCALDRRDVIERPALLAIAGHRIVENIAAKRTFHAQARSALHHLSQALGLGDDACRIATTMIADRDEGMTTLSHADLGIRVVPRGFLPHREISFWRCCNGRVTSQSFDAPLAELLDAQAFARRLKATIGGLPTTALPRAA